jgi:hypothetical protein
MNAMARNGLTLLGGEEAARVVGGCDCPAHCLGQKIGKAINWFFTEWPGSVHYDWTNK